MDGAMKGPGGERLRRQAILAVKIGLVAGVLAAAAALSAYLTVRRSIAGRGVQVPDLSQMTVEEATSALKQRGLLLEEAAQRNDERVEAGRILAQDPLAGSDIKQQRKVKVVVSLGDKVSSIPELRGGAARKAQITLQQQGLNLGNQVYVFSRRDEENMVIAQDPLPESAGLREGKVALLVSRGTPPRTYVMPDLTGRSQSEVVAFLARSGIKAGSIRHEASRNAPPGTVIEQSPAAGFPVRVGDLVTLTLAGAGDDSG
jgi:eukaryotic-like serine/threonine-protein kinase